MQSLIRIIEQQTPLVATSGWQKCHVFVCQVPTEGNSPNLYKKTLSQLLDIYYSTSKTCVNVQFCF